jgi:hypothetical protein
MPTSQTPVAPSNADTEVSHKAGEQREALRPVSEQAPEAKHQEIAGRAGPEPTRFGDWEKNGRCIDF